MHVLGIFVLPTSQHANCGSLTATKMMLMLVFGLELQNMQAGNVPLSIDIQNAGL
jgi:hypothetical protein